MTRHVLHATFALVAFALTACASPAPPDGTARSGGAPSGDAIDNSTPGSGALMGRIWF